MTLSVFPKARGLSWGTRMTPNFNNKISRSANGHETRISIQDQPLWDFEISFEFLPNRRNGIEDLQRILEFFLLRSGSFETFLFAAPETPNENSTLLGTGDGLRTDFSLLRTMGAFSEIAGGVEKPTDILVYANGKPVPHSSFTLLDHRNLRFTTAPAQDVLIVADYLPLFRVRFAEDAQNYEQFMDRLWQLQELELKGVFL